MEFTYIFIVLAATFTIAAIMLATTSRWMAAYMAATAFVCVATVAMAYQIRDAAPTTPAATRAAISALYVASDSAQRAIDADICKHDTPHALDAEARRQYDHVVDAFEAVMTADANALFSFCLAAGER